jgi:universal stress protein A
MPGYSHILLAVDFSPSAEAVASKAFELSQAFTAKLSLIHVVEFVPVDLSNELVLPQAAEMDDELLQVAEQRLRELAARLGTPECPRMVVQGNTRREILRVAEENQVDLIVLGSHGREGIQLLLGSTANAVLHGAPCDVLAVRVTD